MMRWLACAFTLGFLSCGDPWSPVGTFEMIQVWQGGDCGLVTPRQFSITISANPTGDPPFLIAGSEPGTSIAEATLLQFDDECQSSFTFTEPAGTGIGFLGTAVSFFNITDRDGDVEGSGMINVGTPDNCSQVFRVEGMRID